MLTPPPAGKHSQGIIPLTEQALRDFDRAERKLVTPPPSIESLDEFYVDPER